MALSFKEIIELNFFRNIFKSVPPVGFTYTQVDKVQRYVWHQVRAGVPIKRVADALMDTEPRMRLELDGPLLKSSLIKLYDARDPSDFVFINRKNL